MAKLREDTVEETVSATVKCVWGAKCGKQKVKREEEKKSKRNIGGSKISCCLARSHIDSLYSTEPPGFSSHTGMDPLIHPIPIFLVCPAVSHTAAPGTPAMLKLVLPSEIKKKKSSAQSLVGVPATLHAIHDVNPFTARQRKGGHYRE